MSRFPQPQGVKGSLRWIQHLVNQHPDVLNKSIGIGPVECVQVGFQRIENRLFVFNDRFPQYPQLVDAERQVPKFFLQRSTCGGCLSD